MNEEKKPLELLKIEAPQLEAIVRLNAADGVDVKTLVLQELDYLRMQAVTKPEILDCLPSTVVMAVKSVLKQNLTLDPYAGLVYIKTRNVAIMVDGQKVWKKALEIQPSCNGILSVAYQCLKIIDHKSPEVIKNEVGKVTSVEFEFQVSSGRWEKRSFDESDFFRWKRASHKENGRNKADANLDTLNYANENYSNCNNGIDPEFARAKAIRHSLKKLGTNPNEGKFNKIVIEPKKVIIDEVKEEAANNDETTYAEVIEEHTETSQTGSANPVVNSNINPNDL